MSERKKDNTAEDIRGLIEQVDGQLREAERLRTYVHDRHRRPAFFPERRRAPRIPRQSSDDHQDTR
jgi:hypothetical protein